MKSAICSILGAIIFGAICVGVTWAIGAVFGPLYQGEEEANRNFGYFLIAFIAFIIGGAVIGFYAGKKSN